MSKMFTAINRKTGVEWKPPRSGEFLVMYDSGYLAKCDGSDWVGSFIAPLDPVEWQVVFKPALKRKIDRYNQSLEGKQ